VLWVFVGQLGIALGVLAGMKILTQVLDPLEFGRLALANTIVLLIGTNLFGPLGQGFMRFWSISLERAQGHEFADTSNRYAGFLMLLMVAAGLAAFLFISLTRWADWSGLVGISIIVGALTGYLGLRLSVFLAARKRKIVALSNTATAFLKPLIAVLLAFLVVPSAEWVMWGYLGATLIVAGPIECIYRGDLGLGRQSPVFKEEPPRAHRPLGKDILSFSWPFCVWGVFGWIHQSCDRWSLQAFHGQDVVGAFSIISILASYPLLFGANVASNLFIPIAYQRAGERESQPALQSAHRVLFLMVGLFVLWACVVIMVFALFHKDIVLVLSNFKYVAFSNLLPGLTAAWGFFYLGQVFSGFGLLARRPVTYILPIIVCSVLAATATLFLSRSGGAEGVVWGLFISGFAYAVWFAGIGLSLARRSFRSHTSLLKNDSMCGGNL